MGMISSEALAENLGVTHKQVKGLILKYDVRAVPSGSSFMDSGKPFYEDQKENQLQKKTENR